MIQELTDFHRSCHRALNTGAQDLEIENICHIADTRIATLPSDHPLYKPARKSSNQQIRQHLSPLRQIMHNFDIKPKETETIKPSPRNLALTHKRPFSISITASKNKSVDEDTNAREVVKVYSDSSALNGKVGAAAILTRPGKPTRKLHLHLGDSTAHTVHEAELVGLLLGYN